MDGLYIANHHGWLWDGNTMKKCFLSAHRVCPSCIVWMFGLRRWGAGSLWPTFFVPTQCA